MNFDTDGTPELTVDPRFESIFQSMLAALESYDDLTESQLSSEDHAALLIRLSHMRDLFTLRMAKHAGALEDSHICEDWGSTSTLDWMRHKCKIAYGTALDCVHVGRVQAALPQSVDAVETGKIGFGHLSLIARTASALMRSESAEPFDESVLVSIAEENSVGRMWYHLVHQQHRSDPQAVADDQRRQSESRYLRLSEGEDGWLLMSGAFDSIAKGTIMTAIEALARPLGDADQRGRERRQADAMLDLAAHALDIGVPQRAGVRPHVQVSTTLETLQGLIGSPAGEMALTLPISSKTVQRFACDSSITRVLLGADSAVIDAGRAKRVVSANMRRLLDARDKHCRWPSCERPAFWSSAHHLVHWAQGGNTDLSNMILLCQHHHWMVHEGGWRLSVAADGRVLAIPPETDFIPSAFSPREMSASARAPDEFDAA